MRYLWNVARRHNTRMSTTLDVGAAAFTSADCGERTAARVQPMGSVPNTQAGDSNPLAMRVPKICALVTSTQQRRCSQDSAKMFRNPRKQRLPRMSALMVGCNEPLRTECCAATLPEQATAFRTVSIQHS